MHRRYLLSLCISAAAIVPLSVGAQDAAGLPPAKDLIARYAQAVGGDAWKSHRSARMKATVEVPGAGMSARSKSSPSSPTR